MKKYRLPRLILLPFRVLHFVVESAAPLLVGRRTHRQSRYQAAADVFALFRQFNEKFGFAVLLVTHDTLLSDACDRQIRLLDGAIAQG